MTITFELTETVADLLAVLGPVGQPRELQVRVAIEELIDHAQQGVYRPGSWERGWLMQAFGDIWTELIERGDPYGRGDGPDGYQPFMRPKRRSQ